MNEIIKNITRTLTYRGTLEGTKGRGNKRKSRLNISSLTELGEGIHLNTKDGSVYYIRS